MLFAGVYVLHSMPVLGQEGMTSREYFEWFTKTYLSGQGGSYTPEELYPITQLEGNGDNAAAFHAYDGIIQRDVNSFSSLSYANWVKSSAYLNRSKLKAKLNQYWFDDMVNAAELGNVQAANYLSDSMIIWITEKTKKNPEYEKVEVYQNEIARYLRIGAELGSSKSAEILGSDSWPNTLSDSEKLYWKLISISFAQIESKAAVMQSLIQKFGNQQVNQAIKQFSPTGGVIAADASGLPGRGAIATIFADSNLRRTYGESYGRRQATTRSNTTPTTLDEFKLLSAIGDETGLFEAYMLVPAGRKFSNPTIISLKADEIVEKLTAGDTVIVRCGPITHLAVVYKIDKSGDRIYFADGLFQYWQPTHNSCIKTFKLTPHQHGGFLAGVSLKEITPMIQAVMTFRDRTANTSQTLERSKFDDRVKAMGMVFNRPDDYEVVQPKENPYVQFQYALRNVTKGRELRYVLFPIPKDKLAEFRAWRDGKERDKRVLSDPNSWHVAAFMAIVMNIAGEAVQPNMHLPPEIAEEFGADEAMMNVVRPKSNFGEGFTACLILQIHKRDVGSAFIFSLTTGSETPYDSVGALHALRFEAKQ
jgi:hypothetical protein